MARQANNKIIEMSLFKIASIISKKIKFNPVLKVWSFVRLSMLSTKFRARAKRLA